MPGYLEQYGAGEEQREKKILWAAGSIAGLALLGAILYFSFRDFALERQIKQFLEAVRRQDYASAYTYWGCTSDAPCRDYPYNRFLEDWGPQGANAKAATGKVIDSERCGTGYIAAVGAAGSEEVALWVEQETKVVGYAPWRECPEKKLRIRKWLKMRFGIG